MPSSTHTPPRIPDHELIRLIGLGSYGEVWLARNIMGTYRAVKIIYRHTFEHGRPFEREYAGIRKFEPISRSHEGLIQILHVGSSVEAGCFFYVMELADDVSTGPAINPGCYRPKTIRSEIQRQGRVPFEQLTSTSLLLTAALGHLHKSGLLHRDLKPSNIIFVHGRPKIADIGLVSELGESRSFVGTEGFIPPEGPGTPQADLYSLGKVLYEASTGKDRLSFPQIPDDWLELPHHQNLLEFHEVVLKACEGPVERRYQRAEDMQADLALLQSGQSIRHLRALKRQAAVMKRIGLAALLVGALALAGTLLAQRQARLARQNLLRVERAEKQAQTNLWHAYLAQARAERRSGQAGRRFLSLQAISNAAVILPSIDLRNEAIASLALADARPLRQWPESSPQPQAMCFDPAVERYVVSDPQGNLHLRRIEDDQEIAVLPGFGKPVQAGGYLQFSPNGQFLAAFYGNGVLQVWDIASRQIRLALPRDNLSSAFQFTPDSQSFAMAQSGAALTLYSLATGKPTAELHLPFDPQFIMLSPDGRWVAACQENVVKVIALSGADAQTQLEHPGDLLMAAWSGDSQTLATGCADGNIYLWEAATGRQKQVRVGHQNTPVGLLFLEGGRFLLSSSWDGTTRLWDTRSTYSDLVLGDAGIQHTYNPATRRLGFLNWRGTGLFLYELVFSAEPRLIREPEMGNKVAGPHCIAFSPDGRWLGSGSQDGVRLWDLASGRQLAHLPSAHDQSVSFYPDGKSLVTCGGDGLFRRPLEEPQADGLIRVGPPEDLSGKRGYLSGAVSRSGNMLACIRGEALELLRPGQPARRLEGQPDLTFFAVSSDDLWVAGGPRNHTEVTLWDARTGEVKWRRPAQYGAQVSFSPDSRWLVSGSSEEYCFWEVPAGQCARRIKRPSTAGLHGYAAFSNDGTLLAIAKSRTLVELLDARAGTLLAALDSSRPQMIAYLCFSPSGEQLAVAREGRMIELWDLSHLRRELRSLRLDWPTPPPPQAAPKGTGGSGEIRNPKPEVRKKSEARNPKSENNGARGDAGGLAGK